MRALFFKQALSHFAQRPDRDSFSHTLRCKGSLSLIVGSKDYTITENEIAVVDTRKYHIYASNELTEMYWIGFDGCSSDELVTEICRYGHVYVPINLTRTYDLLREILSGFRDQAPLCEELTSSYIHMILSDILMRTKMKKKCQGVHYQ